MGGCSWMTMIKRLEEIIQRAYYSEIGDFGGLGLDVVDSRRAYF